MSGKKTSKKIRVCEGPAYLPLQYLKQHPDNPREISRDDLDDLKASIIAKGLYRPFLVWSKGNAVLSGNKRFEALCELKREGFEVPQVPIVYYSNPDPIMAKKILVESNTHKGTWVDEMLDRIIKEGEEAGAKASDFGMSQAEVDKLVVESTKEAEEAVDDRDLDKAYREPGDTPPKERERDQPLILTADLHKQYMEVLEGIATAMNEDWREGDSIIEAATALIQSIHEYDIVDKIIDLNKDDDE